MIVGCYVLDLYCDYRPQARPPDCQRGRHQFTGRNYSECAGEAKKDGWILKRTKGAAFCPNCSKRLSPSEAQDSLK
jgi:hypothetical protein